MFEKLDLRTPDFTETHIEKLAELFPNCVTEAKDEKGRIKKAIDFDLLKQELSAHIVEGPKERYRLEWPGKRTSLLKANTPITKTLRPSREESVNFDTTRNLYIEGDNLEALKLLQEAYLGKVKMIYIDPPYNTGKDFVYKDNFARSREEELTESGQVDEEGNRLVQNLESNGRFHSDWLSMMYPRLRLARNLLRDDGVIFISIDDNEVHNLRKICDEVFGEGNFVSTFVWKTRQASGKQVSDNNISSEHEYVIIYQKNNIKFLGVGRNRDNYSNPDNDPRGDWAKHPLDVGSTKDERPNCFYDLVDPDTGNIYPANPNRVWAFAPESMQKLINERKIIFHPEGKTKPYLKKFWSELKSEFKPITTWLEKKVFDLGYNTEGTKLVNKLFDGNKIFDYPKPPSLIRLLVQQVTKNDDIILDFFSGSATTAHAVMQLNAEDGGNRRFIMVQLPEPTDPKSEAYKAGYQTIAEIGKERIRRVGKKIREENADKEGIENLDIGFRVLKVDSSNVKDIYFTPDEVSKESLLDTVEHIKEDRTPEDLLFGVLVDWGVDLSLPIRTEEIEGKIVYFVGRGDLAACFEESIDENFVKTLAQRLADEGVLRVVFKESGFSDDNIKINTEQIFKQLAPAVEVRVI